LARNCWADIGGAHVVVTRDDVVLVSARGVEKSIANNRVRRALFSGIYNFNAGQSVAQVWFDRQQGHVVIGYSIGAPAARCRRLMVYDLGTDTWGFQQAGNAAEISVSTAGMLSIRNTGGAVAVDDYKPKLAYATAGDAGLATSGIFLGNEATGTDRLPSSVWHKIDLAMGDPSRYKLVRQIRLSATADSAATFSVEIGARNSINETYTYATAQTWTPATTQALQFLVTGRYIAVRITSNTGGGLCAVLGFDLEYEVQGAW